MCDDRSQLIAVFFSFRVTILLMSFLFVSFDSSCNEVYLVLPSFTLFYLVLPVASLSETSIECCEKTPHCYRVFLCFVGFGMGFYLVLLALS